MKLGSAVQAVLTVSLEWGGMLFNWVGLARFVLAGSPLQPLLQDSSDY